MERVLGLAIATLLVAGVGAASTMEPDRSSDRPAPSTTAPAPRLRPAPGQSRITGQITTLDAAVARPASPLATPFTITVPAPRSQAARITSAAVSGRPSTILWDGGRPLPVTGGPGLDLGALRVAVAPTGITWHLDGEPRQILAGAYQLGATVAVASRAGLATPRDQVSFVAGPDTLLVTQGDARARTDPAPLKILGPGSFTFTGALTVDDGSSVREVSAGRFPGGAFDVELTPTTGGYLISATVDGMIEG